MFACLSKQFTLCAILLSPFLFFGIICLRREFSLIVFLFICLCPTQKVESEETRKKTTKPSDTANDTKSALAALAIYNSDDESGPETEATIPSKPPGFSPNSTFKHPTVETTNDFFKPLQDKSKQEEDADTNSDGSFQGERPASHVRYMKRCCYLSIVALIEETAENVVKSGKDYEQVIKTYNQHNKDMAFLDSDNPYHLYYLWKIVKLQIKFKVKLCLSHLAWSDVHPFEQTITKVANRGGPRLGRVRSQVKPINTTNKTGRDRGDPKMVLKRMTRRPHRQANATNLSFPQKATGTISHPAEAGAGATAALAKRDVIAADHDIEMTEVMREMSPKKKILKVIDTKVAVVVGNECDTAVNLHPRHAHPIRTIVTKKSINSKKQNDQKANQGQPHPPDLLLATKANTTAQAVAMEAGFNKKRNVATAENRKIKNKIARLIFICFFNQLRHYLIALFLQ
ncbi:hypothetical protein RFI_00540 [Reticulomyxa filosa]|uniref:SURP motif domain-containing protein n=1 Tax=Reticulomyxa filosa TaxID=46433 RepID=X6PFQ5_RETFI|nr:hypothetical protein RFI_00540 [Reticulomyxa filosa]|eukprot:ETO36517.1 hypothetical protein RFI_00540 [Reticulomyxa filosa]